MALLEKKFDIVRNDSIKTYDFDRPVILYRVVALRDFGDIQKGDKGGYIEKEENLSQFDTCWVAEHAKVWGDARVTDQARVYGHARISGSAIIYGEANVFGNARIMDRARIGGYARVHGDTQIGGLEVLKGTTLDLLITRGDVVLKKILTVVLGLGSVFLATFCTYMLFTDETSFWFWVVGLFTAPVAAYYSIVMSSNLYTQK